MPQHIAVLPGDGIGPEVIAEAVKVLKAIRPDFELREAKVGGSALDSCGHPLPKETLELCKKSDAVLLGAVGGPKWDNVRPKELRPEIGALLPLRKELNLFANVRPVKTYPALVNASPLKGAQGLVDLVVVRELTGGIYFGTPRERRDNGNVAVDTCIYSRAEIERIAHRAFRIASNRKRNVTSVDKANVLETSRLWREVVGEVSKDYSSVTLTNMLIDNCAMQLIRDPRQFDVILTENMFGDILSDEASMVTGSLGMLPSASLGDKKSTSPLPGEVGNPDLSGEPDEGIFGLYEPVHGSAPDIAGQSKANPLAAILSAALMLRYSLGDEKGALQIERAVENALESGTRTPDIAESGAKRVSTREMGDAVVRHLA